MSTTPSGLQLLALLSTHLHEIINRESANDNHIYLYSTGAYWNAFEKSAYQLARLFPQCAVSSMIFASYSEPIVIASIPTNDIPCLPTGKPGVKFKTSGNDDVLATIKAPTLPTATYQCWHREKTEALEGVAVV